MEYGRKIRINIIIERLLEEINAKLDKLNDSDARIQSMGTKLDNIQKELELTKLENATLKKEDDKLMIEIA